MVDYVPNLFEIVKVTANLKDIKDIYPGCSLDQEGDLFEEVIESYKTKEEAMEALKKYECTARHQDVMFEPFSVEEYFVRSSMIDDDGEFLDGCDYDNAGYNTEDIKFLLETYSLYGNEFDTEFLKKII